MKALVGSLIDGLKAQPVMLAVIVLNLVFIGAATYYLKHLESERQDTLQQMIKSCLESRK